MSELRDLKEGDVIHLSKWAGTLCDAWAVVTHIEIYNGSPQPEIKIFAAHDIDFVRDWADDAYDLENKVDTWTVPHTDDIPDHVLTALALWQLTGEIA